MHLLIFKTVNTELNIERVLSTVGISILIIDCLVKSIFSSRLANEATPLKACFLVSSFFIHEPNVTVFVLLVGSEKN